MDQEPLLPSSSSSKKPRSLDERFTFPELDELTITIPPAKNITPPEFKERLRLGPLSPKDSSTSIESLTFSHTSSRPSSSSAPQDSVVPKEIPNQHSRFPDPDYSCHKTNLQRAKSAPTMIMINNVKVGSTVVNRVQFGSQSIVRQAVILLVLYLFLGVAIHWFYRHDFSATETYPMVDALYFCIVTMSRIGYGEIVPTTTAAKLVYILFVLVGFGFIDILVRGMVLYALNLQERHLLNTVKGRVEKHSAQSNIIDVKKGRMRIRMKVALGFGVAVLCIGTGVVVMHYVENIGWLDSLYLSVMSVTAVGYGDRAFKSTAGRIFASIWLLVSTIVVARAFLYFAEARVGERQRRTVQSILDQDMTLSQFFAADIDNKGFVSKSEYVLYMLKEMGKVSEEDIMMISKKFDRLATGKFRKMTLADL